MFVRTAGCEGGAVLGIAVSCNMHSPAEGFFFFEAETLKNRAHLSKWNRLDVKAAVCWVM